MIAPARAPRAGDRAPARRLLDAPGRHTLPPLPRTAGRRGPPARALPAATSCTTAGCRASTTAGSGSRRCSRCGRELEAALRGRAARDRPGRCRRERRADGRRAAGDRRRRRRPVALASTSSATARSSSSSSSSCTARPTSSRRPTRTRGRCRGSAAAPKAALVEIQADEYGGGDPQRIHASLFARAMEALGLDSALRRLRRPAPGRHAGNRQPDVDCSACIAGCAARSSGTSRCSR